MYRHCAHCTIIITFQLLIIKSPMKKIKKMAKKVVSKKVSSKKVSSKKSKPSKSSKPVKKLTGANKAKDFEVRANKLIAKGKSRGFVLDRSSPGISTLVVVMIAQNGSCGSWS